MKELEGKFRDDSNRPEWYMKSLKNLIYESSSLHSPFVMDLLQADNKVRQDKEEHKIEEKKDACEEEGHKLEKDTKGKDEQQLEEEYEDDFEDISEEESQSGEDPPTSTSSESDDETGSQVTNQNKTNDQEIEHQEPSSDSAAIAADHTFADNIETSLATKTLGQDTSLAKDLVPKNTSFVDVQTPLTKHATTNMGQQDFTSVGNFELKVKAPDSATVAITTQSQPNKVAVNSKVKVHLAKGFDIFGSKESNSSLRTAKSILKMTRSGSSKKAVSFNNIVDGQIFKEDSTLMDCNKEFLVALKPPKQQQQQDKKQVEGIQDDVLVLEDKNPKPYRKVYNVPVYHPIKLTPPAKLPELKNVGKLRHAVAEVVKQEKITAADIFGPSKNNTIYDDVANEDDLLCGENLDDAIDFLLNM